VLLYSRDFGEPDCRAIKALSCALLSMKQLWSLNLAREETQECEWNKHSEEEEEDEEENEMFLDAVILGEEVLNLMIGLSLRAWPPPLLSRTVPLRMCWHELGLPAGCSMDNRRDS
jgi:hypothetical protein